MAEQGTPTSAETSKREVERAAASSSDGIDQRNVVVVTPVAPTPAPSRSSNDNNDDVTESEVDRILRVKNNAYSVLKLDRHAKPSIDDIKKSHRALSRLVHPDKNPGNSRAADASAALNSAVDVLTGDPRKRQIYDLYVESEVEKKEGRGGGDGDGGGGRSFTDWEAETFKAPRWVLRLMSCPGGGIVVGILAVLALLLMIPALVLVLALSLVCFPIRLSLFYCCGLGEPIFASKRQGAGATEAGAAATTATTANERDVELGQQL